VKEENSRGEEDFVPTKLLTRLSYSLEGMEGEVKIGNDGSMVFREDEGMDYQATTVRPPGGEYVPFLFTIKKFEGKGDLDTFSGDFLVPSYRGSTFMDPRVSILCPLFLSALLPRHSFDGSTQKYSLPPPPPSALLLRHSFGSYA